MEMEMEMEMEMDIDIPLPEEFEWLEASYKDESYNISSTVPFVLDDAEYEPILPDVRCQNKRPIPSRASVSPQCDEISILSAPQEKRIRVDAEANGQVIEQELLRYSPSQDEPMQFTEPGMEEREKKISRLASEIDGDFVPVTAPSGGDRIYAKLSMDKGELKETSLSASRWKDDGLLREPVRILLDRIETDNPKTAINADEEDLMSNAMESYATSNGLWVDKYAPKYFTELLSDEHTNREVLVWLKQWDPVVFGSKVRSTDDEVLSALRRYNFANKSKKSFAPFSANKRQGMMKSGGFRKSGDLETQHINLESAQESQKESNNSGVPEHKILLLCGPPGLGKTTLAHVAAKHCGYRVVEINASDDRSTAAIESKILDVVQMNSVTADASPKCLVIDEIDGALSDGKGAVDVILKMVKSSSTKEFASEKEQPLNAKSKKGRKTGSLLRPIICICNDLYAPALRPLRKIAKVHLFVQPTITRIVNRLKYICNREGMRVSSVGLSALAEYTECDIRACLNTLQFLNKKNETLNMYDIGAQVVGRKDVSHSAFDIWNEIFWKRVTIRNRKTDCNNYRAQNKCDNLFSLLSNRGDYDCILDGIHENMLQIQYHDPVMQKTVTCFDTLCSTDLMNQHLLTNQQMSLLAYRLATTTHLLVAQVQKPMIEWPKSYQKCKASLVEKKETLQCWQKQMSPFISRHLSLKSIVEDSISPLLHILSPPTIRPVALNLLTEKEKAVFLELVDVMVSYAITYKRSTCAAMTNSDPFSKASASLAFDPPLQTFSSFKDYSSGHYALPQAAKQILIHEVEKLKIMKVSRTTTPNDKSNNARFGSDATSVAKQPNDNNVKRPQRSHIDFFAKFRKPKDGSADNRDTESTNNVQQKERPLIFKFNEGYTNAIKRPVRMREFIC